MYPSTSLFIAVGQLVIVVLVLFSYPLQVHPCRNCLDKVFHAGDVHALVKPVVPGEPENDMEEDADHAVVEMSPLKHTLITLAIISSGFTIAYFVDDLQMGRSLTFALSFTVLMQARQFCLSLALPDPQQYHSFFLDCFTGR